MKANVHTPERLAGESFKEYRERRVRSKVAAQSVTLFHNSYRFGTYFKRLGNRA